MPLSEACLAGAKVWLESLARGNPMEPLLALQDEVLEWEVNPLTRTPRPDVKEHKEGAIRDLHGSEMRSKAKQSSPPRPLGPKDAAYAGIAICIRLYTCVGGLERTPCFYRCPVGIVDPA
jgi:hypothetical protein